MRPYRVILPLIAVLQGAIPAPAQFRLSTLAEFQLGNLPGESPRDLRSLYHQLDLDYSAKGFEAVLRTEVFGSSASKTTFQDRIFFYLARPMNIFTPAPQANLSSDAKEYFP